MIYKNNVSLKFISFILVVAILLPSLGFLSFPKKAEAQFGIDAALMIPFLTTIAFNTGLSAASNTTLTVKTIAIEVLKQILMTAVRRMLNQMTQSTINWINTGNWGNPFFLENPESFFKDIVKYEVKAAIDTYAYDLRRFPFGKDFALGLAESYQRQADVNAEYTLNKLMTEEQAYEFRNNFNVGGWNGFIINTQYPQNNYLGFQMIATENLTKKLAGLDKINSTINKVNTALEQGQGFLSPQTCADNNGNNKYNDTFANQFKRPTWNESEYQKTQPYKNPYTCVISPVDGLENEGVGSDCASYYKYKEEWEGFRNAAKASWTEDNTCKRLVNTTPGSVVASQIMNSMSSKIRQSELGAALGNSLSAVFDALINRLFKDGLNALTNKNYTGEGEGGFNIDFTGADETAENFLGTTNTLGELYGENIIVKNQCTATGNVYGSALLEAMTSVISENPDVANLPNIEDGSGKKENARTFLELVAEKLKSSGYNATAEVLNGNNNPSTGDIIAVWKEGDTSMERYDAISGNSGKTVGESTQVNFDAFIPLNCYSGGGGTECGCQTGGGGNNTETPPATPTPTTNPNPASGNPYISLVTPVSAKPGTTTITITGDNLTSTVQFFDGDGGSNTVTGALNAEKTQVIVLVPANQPIGNATVKIYRDASTVSNGKLIQISNTGGGLVSTTPPTTIWSPTQTVNGWWSSLSPDGKYVSYGNWGGSWVTDLQTKQNYDFSKPAGLPAGARCLAGQWIKSDTLSFVCEVNTIQFYRYEVKVGEWIAKKTDDNPNLVAGNIIKAADGHWASWLGAGKRIARDNEVILENIGGALSISSNTVAYACDSENSKICFWKDSGAITQYPPKVPVHQIVTKNGYIVYGGYGPVRGINPSGVDVELRLASTLNEGIGEIFFVNGAPWVATVAWEPAGSKSYVFLRPWKETKVLAIEANAVGVSVVHRGTEFVVAYWSDVGKMQVVTVPSNSPRSVLK